LQEVVFLYTGDNIMTLREQLLSEGKTNWLDVGIGLGKGAPQFTYVDIKPRYKVRPSVQGRYHRLDIAKAAPGALRRLGKFDFIRSQHMFEHLTFEDGLKALKNCAKLLKKDGLILVTVPDLRIHVDRYLKNDYATWSPGWLKWARGRVPTDAPPSALFSVFAHSKPGQAHVWCYDAEGLIYQFKRSKAFTDIRELKLTDRWSEEPFTHNRSNEDVCIVARKK
jgi:predicted SAM-dependent methyltransferase